MKRTVAVFTIGLLAAVTAFGAGEGYHSPYRVTLPFDQTSLIPDLLEGERGAPRLEARIPSDQWYDHAVVGPWGPQPREYPYPEFAARREPDWKRARVIATALRYLGYNYRHHYIPDWDPPEGWHTPAPGAPPHAGKGFDCSNFTSFVYNQSMGVGISSDVVKQSGTQEVVLQGLDRNLEVEIIPRKDSVEQWVQALKPGDLLFIRAARTEEVTHVVIWLGDWGQAPDGTPLVLDSHGADTRDADGVIIPQGVQLRPFRNGSWYATRADHAIRIIRDRY